MSEWKGPWKCKKCGAERDDPQPGGYDGWTCHGGTWEPYDRRAPNPLLPLVRELRDALTCADRDLAETAVITGYRMRNDTAQKMTDAFAHADKALAGESGDSGKQRREDFVAGAAYGGYMDFGKSTAKEAGEQARTEALRRYPEKPQEGKGA